MRALWQHLHITGSLRARNAWLTDLAVTNHAGRTAATPQARHCLKAIDTCVKAEKKKANKRCNNNK